MYLRYMTYARIDSLRGRFSTLLVCLRDGWGMTCMMLAYLDLTLHYGGIGLLGLCMILLLVLRITWWVLNRLVPFLFRLGTLLRVRFCRVLTRTTLVLQLILGMCGVDRLRILIALLTWTLRANITGNRVVIRLLRLVTGAFSWLVLRAWITV